MLGTRFFCLGRDTPLHCQGVITSERSHTGSNLETKPCLQSLSNGPCEAQPPQELRLEKMSCIDIVLAFPQMLKNSQLWLHIPARELSSLACAGTGNFNIFMQGL